MNDGSLFVKRIVRKSNYCTFVLLIRKHREEYVHWIVPKEHDPHLWSCPLLAQCSANPHAGDDDSCHILAMPFPYD